MADLYRMTVNELAGKLLSDEHAEQEGREDEQSCSQWNG